MNYDRVILELLDRVSVLEDEVKLLKLQFEDNDGTDEDDEVYSPISSTGRDTTKYLLDGKRYGKNRLVLAIVKKYVIEHPDSSKEHLMEVFDKSLQGSLGVIRELKEVKNSYSDYRRRFFVASDEVIDVSNGVCVVCTQWGKENIGNIIARAKQLEMNITILK
ncbi:MAG: hypothetical protein PHX08_10745 [Lachnospiraceae bacterium]|nr:hypothetical protein [Lachnospiraceae bacterium]